MGNETTGRIMPIYSDMLLNSEDPKVLILPASVDKAIIVTTKNNKRLDEVLDELERSGGTIKSIELNGDTVAIGENGTVNLGNLLSGESLKTINNEGLVGNTNINLINAVFGKYGTEGNVTTFLVPRINDNTEAFVPATASEHTLYIDVYNNKIYRYVDNEYVVALDTSGFALKTELDEKANASDVVPNNRTVNNKPLSSDVTIGMSDIQGLEEAIGHIEAGTTVVINSDGANVVDSHSNPSILVAPSARQMMMAANNIDILFRKVNDLYDKLAGIAFTEDKPANWKENANWLTPAVPTHTITRGTMTNVSASLNGTVINDSTSADEGKVTILLTPSGNNYMSGISIKDASNHDVDFTQTDVAGGTEITFILYGNVTINASASSGIQVNVSGDGITSYTTGVEPNTAAVLTIPLPVHRTWGTVTITYGTDDITSQCDISQANNADKAITLPDNLSDMNKVISIVANAVEDNFATLDLENVGENVVVNHDATEHLYVGDTITIQPASGFKLGSDTAASIGGEPLSLTGNDYVGYSYTLGTNDVSNGGSSIVISATAEQVETFEITIPSVNHVAFKQGNEELSGTIQVTEGANFECDVVLDESDKAGGINYHLTDITIEKGNDDITSTAFDFSTKKITINNVDDDIVISNIKTAAFCHDAFLRADGKTVTTSRASGWAYINDFIDIPSWCEKVVICAAYAGPRLSGDPNPCFLYYNNSNGVVTFNTFGDIPGRHLVGISPLDEQNEQRYFKIRFCCAKTAIDKTYVFAVGTENGIEKREYLHRGFLYDGRNEDIYNLQLDDIVPGGGNIFEFFTDYIDVTPNESQVLGAADIAHYLPQNNNGNILCYNFENGEYVSSGIFKTGADGRRTNTDTTGSFEFAKIRLVSYASIRYVFDITHGRFWYCGQMVSFPLLVDTDYYVDKDGNRVNQDGTPYNAS